jgi:hypothetical protein
MKTLQTLVAVLATTLATPTVFAQTASTEVSDPTPFVELLTATRFIENYKETAAVSARVFAARGQGSDKEYSAFMAKVASANLSDMRLCLAHAYAATSLTIADARELVAIFKTPIGLKVIDLSQRWNLSNITRGSVKPMDASLLSDSERIELSQLYKRSVFARYNSVVAGESIAAATRACLGSSKVAKEADVKF